MNLDFKKCLERGALVKINFDYGLVEKEINEAEKDLKSAEKSLSDNDPKWAIIQAYYSMFHAAKGLVFLQGYREKSHYCLLTALEELYVLTNKIEPRLSRNFRECMISRMDADYGLAYSDRSAEHIIKVAKEFLQKSKELTKR
ncbi:MAG: HEPN domain-containing protein [Candidatus Micrarchaeota archaeon]